MRRTRDNLDPFNFSGLCPSGDLEAAKCDAAMDFASDFLVHVWPYYTETDPAKKVLKSAYLRTVGVVRISTSQNIFYMCTILVRRSG